MFDKIKAFFESQKAVTPPPPFTSPKKEDFNLPNDANVAVFKDGTFVRFFQEGGSFDDILNNAKFAEYVISDQVLYNMNDAKSIESIVIPNFKENDGMPNTSLDMAYHFFVRLKKEKRADIVVALAKKTADLMLKSPISWDKKDYYRVVIQLWSTGHFRDGDVLLENLKKKNPIVAAENEEEELKKQVFNNCLSLAKEFNEDYILTSGGNCCEKCAPYRCRMYSISGADKRFPKFSDYIPFPEKMCCLSFSGTHYYKGKTLTEYRYREDGSVTEYEVEAITHSNRPFIDDRPEYHKELSNEWQQKREKRRVRDENYYSRQHWVEDYESQQEYEQIVLLLGEKAPKSYTGYKRMKQNNTPNFQKIMKIANENGIDIKVKK